MSRCWCGPAIYATLLSWVAQPNEVESRWGWTRIPMVVLPLAIAAANMLLLYFWFRRLDWTSRRDLAGASVAALVIAAATIIVWYALASMFAVPLALGESGWATAPEEQRLPSPEYSALRELNNRFGHTLGNLWYPILVAGLDFVVLAALAIYQYSRPR